MSRTSGFACSKTHQIFCVSPVHVGSKTSGEFSICGKHPTRLPATPGQMNVHPTWTGFLGWRGGCSGKHGMFLCLLWRVPGTASFQTAWTWHKESLVKTVSSPLDLEKQSSQKNVLHVIVNMSTARLSHQCWYSCHPNLMEKQMWNQYLRDASKSCASKAYFWIMVFWLQNTGRGWEWGIPNGVSSFHWEKKQRKYLKKQICPMLASVTINYYFRVIMFYKYSSKKAPT